MGLRDRLRIERIRLGLEQPRSGKSVIPESYDAKQTRPLIATKCPSITSWTEIKTCNQIMRLLSIPRTPQHIVREKTKEGMYKVVTKLKQAGETKDSIFKFYWDIPEFQSLWKKLGYNENDWREVVNSNG